MTRISKRIIGWLLGVLAALSIALGIYFAMPQSTKLAKADTAVTFNAACIGEGVEESGDGYDYAVRFDTSELTWTVSQNYVAASSWTSVSDYTTINGRTITEWNNAYPNAKPILLKLQPAATFSFLRLYIDSDMLALSDIYSMGILEGWSYQGNDSAEKYTSTTVTFLRSDSTMVLSGNYTGTLFSNTVEISDAELKNYTGNSALANYGSDSWVVDITVGSDYSANSGYNTMYSGYLQIRKSIYINGKSIEEWNKQKIEEDSRFGDPSTYTVFPQNSTDSTHADVFVKPVGLWGTSTGFRVTIFKELVADAEKIVVTIGEGAFVNHGGMMTSRITKTVHTQNVKDATNSIGLFTNSLASGCITYYLNVGETTSEGGNYWTTSATSGVVSYNEDGSENKANAACLNVFDPSNAGGGQSILKYIYFNGTSLWDINKKCNDAFGATNAIANGPNWAPILAQLNDYNGGSITLNIPIRFAGLDENGDAIDSGENYTDGNATSVANHQTIELKKGLSIYDSTTGYSTYLSNDIVFENTTDGALTINQYWTKTINPVEEETEVSVTQKFHGGGFLSFTLSNNDYPTSQTQVTTDTAKAAIASSNLYSKISVNGTSLASGGVGEIFFALGGSSAANTIAIRINSIQGDTNYTNSDTTNWSGAGGKGTTVVIEKGAQFPCYDYLVNGGSIRYYVTTEDLTFVYDATTDDFVLKEDTTEYTVTYTVDGVTYHTETVASGGTATAPATPTKDGYTFNYWALNGAEYDFSTAVTGNITLEATFDADSSGSTDIYAVASFTIGNQGTISNEAGESTSATRYIINTCNTSDLWTTYLDNPITRSSSNYSSVLSAILINGKSIADWNAEADAALEAGTITDIYYGADTSIAGRLASAAAPIAVCVGYANSESHGAFFQIDISDGFISKVTSVAITSDFELDNGSGIVYYMSSNVYYDWVNNTWYYGDNCVFEEDVTINNATYDGGIYKVAIQLDGFTFDGGDVYDYNYWSSEARVSLRKNLYINGKSLFDVAKPTNETQYGYTYTSTMATTTTQTYNGSTYYCFMNPYLLYAENGGDTLVVWLDDEWVADLIAENGEITLTVGAGFAYGGKVVLEDVSYTLTTASVTVTVDGATTTHTVLKNITVSALNLTTPSKEAEGDVIYTFSGWVDGDGNTVTDSTVITGDMEITAVFTETVVATYDTTVTGIKTYASSKGENFVLIEISNNDYSSCATTGISDLSGLVDKIVFSMSDGSYSTYQNAAGEKFFNVWSISNTVAFRWGSYTTLPTVESITILAGARFPAATASNTYYVTTEEITIYQIATDIWLTQAEIDEMLHEEDVTINNATYDSGIYKVAIQLDGFTFDKSDMYDYNWFATEERVSLRKNLYINGKSLFDVAKPTNETQYGYTYTSTMATTTTQTYNGSTYYCFMNPYLLYAENGGDTLVVWLDDEWVADLIAENGEITLTVGAGFAYGDMMVVENVSYTLTTDVTAYVDGKKYDSRQNIMKGTAISDLGFVTPSKEATDTYTYTFSHWADSNGEEITTVTDSVIKAVFTEKEVAGTTYVEILGVHYQYKQSSGAEDNWLVFTLSESDYSCDATTTLAINEDFAATYKYLCNIGFLQGITVTYSENDTEITKSLADFYSEFTTIDQFYFNIWGESCDTFAIRCATGNTIKSVTIAAGTSFPSYRCAANSFSEDYDYRYTVSMGVQYVSSHDYGEKKTMFASYEETTLKPTMVMGASVRIKDDLDGSGICFQTIVSNEIVAELEYRVDENWYDSVSFGTIIVPADYLMGGQFTHEWLTANYGDSTLNGGTGFIDIKSSGWYRYQDTDTERTFLGSIVKLKEGNYSRAFSGRGYIKLTKGSQVTYIYADYDPALSRSAAFVAKAAYNDDTVTYTEDQKTLLQSYFTVNTETTKNESVELTYGMDESSALNADGRRDLVFDNYISIGKTVGPRVTLNYTTSTDVWGQFVYATSDTDTNYVYEEFYLPAYSSQHRQYLDVYRSNGVWCKAGNTASPTSLYLVKIGFAAATSAGAGHNFKLITCESETGTYNTDKAQQYLTKTIESEDGDYSLTIGAHLGLGGSFTYLAKSGIYEGVVGQTSGKANTGSLALQTKKDGFDATRTISKSWVSETTEDGYYGGGSEAGEGTSVNLINNYDAGRQVQQSWYANVGGSDEDATGANGYQRTYCLTGSEEGHYWPYNPVQAGDVVSNPSQIVDFEIVEDDYIYVKCRAMDWAKGKTSADGEKFDGVEGGVTTRSYMENYYRINDDGTVTVTNSFIDWNGFTGMDSIDYHSIELPAVYPIHTLYAYHSDTNGDGTTDTWTNLGSWTTAGLSQKAFGVKEAGNSKYGNKASGYNFTTDSEGNAVYRVTALKSTDWFAWSNNNDSDSIAFGVYIPNVASFTSGRIPDEKYGSTGIDTSYGASFTNAADNRLKEKSLLSGLVMSGLTYESAYVDATSYTAPGIVNKMEEYSQIEYSYVVYVDTLTNVENMFNDLASTGKVDNSGLDKWARDDKSYTW